MYARSQEKVSIQEVKSVGEIVTDAHVCYRKLDGSLGGGGVGIQHT